MTNQITIQQREVAEFIDHQAPKFKEMLPEGVSVSKFTRAAKNAILANPELARADKQSLFVELSKACKDGLIPDGREAYINVFKGKATYIPMVDGAIRLLTQGEEVSHIIAKAVYEGDQFGYWINQDTGAEHVAYAPILDHQQRGKLRAAFATVYFKNGSRMTEFVLFDDIQRSKQASRGANNAYSPWVKHEAEMWIKTAIHKLAKRMPRGHGVAMIEEVEREFSEEKEVQQEAPLAVDNFLNQQPAQPQAQQAPQQAPLNGEYIDQ